MKKVKTKIIFIFLIIIIILQNTLTVYSAAILIKKADLEKGSSINTHIQFKKNNKWVNVVCNYIHYNKDNKKYPAYCINHGLHGVDEEGAYTVNISKVLEDEVIWRTIINGYPYVTPEKLGLDTKEEAYVATKQAVFSIMENRDVKSFYKAKDEKGQKIIDAIYKISEKGKNGTQKYKTASIYLNKNEEINKLNENYYYIEYSINCNTQISKFSIDEDSNIPKGAFFTDQNNNRKKEFNGNEKFRLVFPKKALEENIFGNIIIKSSCETFPVYYGKAPKNNIQDYAITGDSYQEFENEFKIELKTNKSVIKVIKKDEETLKPIEGVKFSLLKDNTVIETIATDQNGQAEFKNLYASDNYVLKEIKSKDEYIPNEKEIKLNLEYKQLIEKVITNRHKKGGIRIIKVDADNEHLTLGAIEFDLISVDDGSVVAHLSTDADGIAEVNNINTGDYILRETKTKKEYDICIDKNLKVNWNDISEYVIKNEKKKGKIKVIKQDSEKSDIRLSGVKFIVLNSENRIVDEIITDQNGEGESSRLPIGDYTIKEVDLGNNKDYIIDSTEIEMKVNNQKTSVVTAKNKHKTGSLEILKVDKDTQKPIKNVKFEVIDKIGNRQIITTNENGIAFIENIRVGDAIIREIETQNEYELLENEINIKIKYKENNCIKIENEKIKGQVEIYKTDKEDSNIKIQGVKFKILDEDKTEVDNLITNKNGYAISKKLPIGKYTIIETKTNENYVLNSKNIEFEIKSKEKLTYNITNRKIKGKIKIIKTSKLENLVRKIKQNDPIEGVIFEIFNINNKKVDEIITNKDGIAISNELKRGIYKVKEKYATEYFLVDEKEYVVKIINDNEILELNIENMPHIPETKIDKNGPEKAEAGQEINYKFNIKNTGNVMLEKFTWKEFLPYESINITKMQTGTYNEEMEYSIFYKTNKGEYSFLKKANTYKNEYINFEEIQLEKNEKIIEIKVEFGEVKEGFSSIQSPILYAITNSKLKEGDFIENKTKIEGYDYEYLVSDQAKCTTKIYKKEITKKLPRTGC